MAQERRPSFDRQISSDGPRKGPFQRIRTKSVIPKKVPNLTNLPHSFKREKFKCIKMEDNELNAHLIKFSQIKKCVSCYKIKPDFFSTFKGHNNVYAKLWYFGLCLYFVLAFIEIVIVK